MSSRSDEEHDDQDVFLDESDVLEEINIDEEDLPDAGDGGDEEEIDDSVHLFTGHTGELYALASSPTQPLLVATGGGDDKTFLWKIGHGDWAQELPERHDSVSSLAFSSDGKLLASGGLDGLIQIWDVSSGSLKCKLEGPGSGIEWVRWHPRGHVVLAGFEDSTVWMWNADKNAYLNMFSGHGSSVTCGDFTPDGKTICTGSDDASLRIWDPKEGTNKEVKGHYYHREGLTCMAITKDSARAITGSKDGSVHMVNITTGKVISSLTGHTDSVECVGLCQSFPWAATGSMDNKLLIWDLNYSSIHSTCQHEEGVTCLAWIGSSIHVATGSGDGIVRIWDSRSGECVKEFRGHSDVIQSITVTADGEHIVSVSIDGTARAFELN
ncbi:hypothetical protein ACHQM5_019196 [Ranunculus cassubicifolius]